MKLDGIDYVGMLVSMAIAMVIGSFWPHHALAIGLMSGFGCAFVFHLLFGGRR